MITGRKLRLITSVRRPCPLPLGWKGSNPFVLQSHSQRQRSSAIKKLLRVQNALEHAWSTRPITLLTASAIDTALMISIIWSGRAAVYPYEVAAGVITALIGYYFLGVIHSRSTHSSVLKRR